MTSNTRMVRDELGSPVPQTVNEDGTYTVLSSGSATDIDFSKHKLLRDELGSPLPYQYFSVELNKFVAGTIGGNSGNGNSGNGVHVSINKPQPTDGKNGDLWIKYTEVDG